MFENLDFENALELFDELGSFKDSNEYKELCVQNMDYNEAVGFMEAEEYLTAKQILDIVPEFKDSADLIFICDCRLLFYGALEELNNAKHSEALEILK